jgi:hypothetical protein
MPALVLGGLYLVSKGGGSGSKAPFNPMGFKYTLPDGSTRYYDGNKLAPGTIQVLATETNPLMLYGYSGASYASGSYDDSFALLAVCNFYRRQQGKSEIAWPPTAPYPG